MYIGVNCHQTNSAIVSDGRKVPSRDVRSHQGLIQSASPSRLRLRTLSRCIRWGLKARWLRAGARRSLEALIKIPHPASLGEIAMAAGAAVDAEPFFRPRQLPQSNIVSTNDAWFLAPELLSSLRSSHRILLQGHVPMRAPCSEDGAAAKAAASAMPPAPLMSDMDTAHAWDPRPHGSTQHAAASQFSVPDPPTMPPDRMDEDASCHTHVASRADEGPSASTSYPGTECSVRRASARSRQRAKTMPRASIPSSAASMNTLLPEPLLPRPGPDGSAASAVKQQEQEQDGPNVPLEARKELTRVICSCLSWHELRSVVELSSGQMDHIHVAAALVRAAKLSGARRRGTSSSAASRSPLPLSPSAAASSPGDEGGASLSDQQGLPAVSDLWILVQDLCGRLPSCLPLVDQRQASNMLWSLAMLAPELADGSKPSKLTMCRAAVEEPELEHSMGDPELEPGVEAGAAGAEAEAHEDLPESRQSAQKRNLLEAVTGAAAAAREAAGSLVDAMPRLWSQGACPQSLSMTAWAVAKLGMRPTGDAWLNAFLEASQPLLTSRQFRPSELSTLLWSLATLRVWPGGRWAAAASHACSAGLAAARVEGVSGIPAVPFGPQALSNTLWAVTKLRLPFPEQLMDRLRAECLTQLQGFSPQHLSSVMWALSTTMSRSRGPGARLVAPAAGPVQPAMRSQLPMPPFGTGQERCQIGLGQDSSRVLPGLPKQDLREHAGPDHPDVAGSAQPSVFLQAQYALEPGSTALQGCALVAAAKLSGVLQPATEVGSIARRAAPGCVLVTAPERAAVLQLDVEVPGGRWEGLPLCSSADAEGCRAEGLLAACAARAEGLLGRMSFQGLASTAWALARVGHVPSAAWTRGLLQQAARKGRGSGMSPTSLCMLLWALSRWGTRPDPKWMLCITRHAKEAGLPARMTACHAAAALTSIAELHAVPDAGFLHVLIAATGRRMARSCSAQDASRLCWALGALRAWPGKAWLRTMWGVVLRGHASLGPWHIARLLSGVADMPFAASCNNAPAGGSGSTVSGEVRSSELGLSGSSPRTAPTSVAAPPTPLSAELAHRGLNRPLDVRQQAARRTAAAAAVVPPSESARLAAPRLAMRLLLSQMLHGSGSGHAGLLCEAVWAAVRLGCHPPPDYLAALLQTAVSEKATKLLSARAAVRMLCACASLGAGGIEGRAVSELAEAVSEQVVAKASSLQAVDLRLLSALLSGRISRGGAAGGASACPWRGAARRVMTLGLGRLPTMQLVTMVGLTAAASQRRRSGSPPAAAAAAATPAASSPAAVAEREAREAAAEAYEADAAQRWGQAVEAATLKKLVVRRGRGGITVATLSSLLGALLLARRRPSQAWLESWCGAVAASARWLDPGQMLVTLRLAAAAVAPGGVETAEPVLHLPGSFLQALERAALSLSRSVPAVKMLTHSEWGPARLAVLSAHMHIAGRAPGAELQAASELALAAHMQPRRPRRSLPVDGYVDSGDFAAAKAPSPAASVAGRLLVGIVEMSTLPSRRCGPTATQAGSLIMDQLHATPPHVVLAGIMAATSSPDALGGGAGAAVAPDDPLGLFYTALTIQGTSKRQSGADSPLSSGPRMLCSVLEMMASWGRPPPAAWLSDLILGAIASAAPPAATAAAPVAVAATHPSRRSISSPAVPAATAATATPKPLRRSASSRAASASAAAAPAAAPSVLSPAAGPTGLGASAPHLQLAGPHLFSLLRVVALLQVPVTEPCVRELLSALAPARLRELNAKQAAEVAWALGVLQYRPDAAWWESYEAVLLALPGEAAAAPAKSAAAATAASRAAAARAKSIKGYGAASRTASSSSLVLKVLKAAGSTSRSSAPLQQQVLRPAQGCILDLMPGKQLCEVAWACAALRLVPSPVLLSRLAACAARHLPSLAPASLSNLLWSITVLDPGGEAISTPFPASSGEVPASSMYGTSGGGHLSWRSWMDRWLSEAAGKMGGFEAQDLAMTASALAATRCKPRQDWLAKYLAQALVMAPLCRGPQLVRIACGLAEIDCRPDPIWVEAFAARARHPSVVLELDDGAAGQMAWALDRLLPGRSGAGRAAGRGLLLGPGDDAGGGTGSLSAAILPQQWAAGPARSVSTAGRRAAAAAAAEDAVLGASRRRTGVRASRSAP